MRADGTLVAAGMDLAGVARAPECAVGDWRDVVAVAAGSHHIVGVDARGRVWAAGDDRRGQCEVGGWRDVVAVAAGAEHSLGLRADGTVLAAGSNDNGQCETEAWELGAHDGAREREGDGA